MKLVINYHERKVGDGMAERIYACKFLQDAADLTRDDLMNRFGKLHELNKRVIRNTIQFMLAFSPKDELDKDKLIEIASLYMERVGFGEQPYLVYRHRDTVVPHLHIVSTTIRSDGSKINDFNIGRFKSVPAREEIIRKYGLTSSRERSRSEFPDKPEKLQYGKVATFAGIADVATYVFDNYLFTSFDEFNAVLSLFNVKARRKGDSLAYVMLNEQGKQVTKWVNASQLWFKVSHSDLIQKSRDNILSRAASLDHAKNSLLMAMGGGNMESMPESLLQANIDVAPYVESGTGGAGYIFIDHKRHVVLTDKELGEEFVKKVREISPTILLHRLPNPERPKPGNRPSL
ncbi:MAG: relaxase/mobilization nuclease domain-containing protein [Bacteroidetes bacterium]|nr:relaxase/mobilization nuclease domain-containing protein [Bacteroidota bacterium]